MALPLAGESGLSGKIYLGKLADFNEKSQLKD
jgi:hypothetical protein